MKNSSAGRDIPPPLELECLKALWRLGDGTVKDVRGILTESRNLAYTTVMTVLDRLEKRGSVRREKVGRSFVYTPVLGQQQLRSLAVEALVNTFFEGSRAELMAFLEGRSETGWATGRRVAAEPSETEDIRTELL